MLTPESLPLDHTIIHAKCSLHKQDSNTFLCRIFHKTKKNHASYSGSNSNQIHHH